MTSEEAARYPEQKEDGDKRVQRPEQPETEFVDTFGHVTPSNVIVMWRALLPDWPLLTHIAQLHSVGAPHVLVGGLVIWAGVSHGFRQPQNKSSRKKRKKKDLSFINKTHNCHPLKCT